MIRFSVVLLLGLLLWPVARCALAVDDDSPAATTGPEVVEVRVGFAGYYKTGLWTPVEVTLRGTAGLDKARVRVTVPDGDGVQSRVGAPLPSPAPASAPVHQATVHQATVDDSVSVLLYVRFGRLKSRLRVEVVSSDEVVLQREFQAGLSESGADFRPALFSDQGLIVVVGTESVGAEELFGRLRRGATEKGVVVRLDDARKLPDRWVGYEAVDAVVLSTGDATVFSGLGPKSPRIAALDDWVRMGGRLLVCAGRDAGELLGSEPEGPLARFVPGRLSKRVALRDTRSLEIYCNSKQPVPAASGSNRVELDVWQLDDVDGLIEARHLNRALVVRRSRAFGQIVFFAADLSSPPLASWKERRLLVGRLLDISPRPADRTDRGKTLVHFGYRDVAGQLRSALDRFGGVWRIPFGLVAGLVFLYLVAIGPGDYFLVRKLLKRMQWTWISFPAIVVAFCVGSYVLARWSKGDEVRLNQVDLVDVDTESGQLRGTTWATVFSPAMERYDLSVKPKLLDGTSLDGAEVVVSWLGLPGTGLGGMNPSTAPPAGWREPYDFSPRLDELQRVPVPIWATKSFTARWRATSSDYPTAALVRNGQVPNGTITNTLDFPLNRCLLAYGNWAYELGSLAPGESVRVGPTKMRRELNSLLTGRKLVFEQSGTLGDVVRETAVAYDRGSGDEAYILRAMMFFGAAGGHFYTGLSNSHQGFVDMSRLLQTDRAVLVAWVGGDDDDDQAGGCAGAELSLSRRGEPLEVRPQRHLRVLRFVFPVAEKE